MISEPDSIMDHFTVSYRIQPPAGVSPGQFAQDIAEEQTVEIPHDTIPRKLIDNGVVGRVAGVYPDGEGVYKAEIEYRGDITAYSAPQLLNILFGNISLKHGIRITGLAISEKMAAAFGGPAFGIEGVRQAVGISGRPLLCTALKPMGLSNIELAEVAGACARGGVDLIKDDHGIGDQPFSEFEERVARVTEVIARADARTGNSTLYFPNLCGPRDAIERQAEFAVRNGIRAVLLAPGLVGFDTAQYVSSKYGLIVMAHPAFTGTLFTSATCGMAPDVFLGTIYRLIGADISIFPSWDGRFPFTRDECIAVAAALTGKLSSLRSAFPAPAGGITLDRIGAIAEAFGSEAVLLVGGALLGSDDLSGSVKQFHDELGKHFQEERQSPRSIFGSSCEVRSREADEPVVPVLRFEGDGWKSRRSEAYKPEGASDFKEILRTELIGGSGVNTAFDVRYFEIGAGGYSSLEKHVHEHVIIGVRGAGVLVKDGTRFDVRPNDIAYVGPLEPHQLHNEGADPFGFYCIVDHHRDRPQPV